MTPTPRLRFVKRWVEIDGNNVGRLILQQWYTYAIDYPTEKGEWCDVPVEVENE